MIPIISKVDFYLWTEKRKCKVRVNRMLGAGTTQLSVQTFIQKEKNWDKTKNTRMRNKR